MRRSIRSLSCWVFLALVMMVVPSLRGRSTPAQAKAPAQTAATCAALGTYQIGPRLLPLAPSGHKTTASPTVIASPTVTARRTSGVVAWPAWILRGTLTIAAYSGCGSPTAGIFSVHRSMIGPIQPQQSHRASNIACYSTTCWQPPYGIVAASGSFGQDAAHPLDPTFVTVTATLTTTRPGLLLGRPCRVGNACPSSFPITSTTTISGITGYLQIEGDDATMPNTSAQVSAILSFLPPPALSNGDVPSVLVLQAWRAQAHPSVAPTPSP